MQIPFEVDPPNKDGKKLSWNLLLWKQCAKPF